MSIQSLITASLASAVLSASSDAITIYGLGSGGQIYSFDTLSPGTMNTVGAATAGSIVDIDFRGSNNKLYGLAATGATSTISVSNGLITPLFTPSHSLGTVSGFDFNPALDRMRIIGGGVNNFRMVPDGIAGMTAGTVVNGAGGGDGMFGVPMGVTLLDVAYINPFNGGAGTNLFSIGSNGILYNHPAIGAPQFNTISAVGPLGISLAGDIGFDIDASGTGYLVTGNSLYTVNLATGEANLSATLSQSLTSIAVVPEPSATVLGGLAGLAVLRRRRTA
ncbi:MAG: DUF4394 domain-containing protein [Verrucomicrobiota bacterium]